MSKHVQFNNNPLIYTDLGFFLKNSLEYLFNNNILKETVNNILLKIWVILDDEYIHYLTKKYTSMRFDYDIEYVGLELLKELIEYNINIINNNSIINVNDLLDFINLKIKYKKILNDSIKTIILK
jgi:hypothetical protein